MVHNNDFMPQIAKAARALPPFRGASVGCQRRHRRTVSVPRAQYPNKMSRMLLCCSDGGTRSEIAANRIVEQGYTWVKVGCRLPSLPLDFSSGLGWVAGADESGLAQVIKGGMDEYLKAFPLTDKDKKDRVANIDLGSVGMVSFVDRNAESYT